MSALSIYRTGFEVEIPTNKSRNDRDFIILTVFYPYVICIMSFLIS